MNRNLFEAVELTAAELTICLDLANERATPDRTAMARFVRDRLAALIIRLPAGEADGLLAAGSYIIGVFNSAARVRALLDLAPPSSNLHAAQDALPEDDVRSLLSGLLLRLPQDVTGLVRWIVDERCTALLIHYVAWQPKSFRSDLERRRHLDYITDLCGSCADIYASSMSKPIRALLDHLVMSLRSGTIYSCEGSLIDYARAKARLICALVRTIPAVNAVPDPDHDPERLPSDHVIRLGLLWNDGDRRTENVVGVASSRGFRAHGFHVTSILCNSAYHGAGSHQPTILEDLQSLSDDIVTLYDHPALPDRVAAIRALDLDCIIFMNNVTFGFNDYVALAACRLAGWQAVNFCAVFTTGFPTIDLYVSGTLSERSAAPEHFYTERLVRLPGSCLIFDHPDRNGGAVPVTGLSRSLRDASTATLFASGANLYKIHPGLSATWARILALCPNARLVLYPFNPNWDVSYPVDLFVERFTRQLLAESVDPERVTIAGPWRDPAAIDEILATTDIYLDSFPHSGGLSSLDALRLGVPVVTRQGETQRENQSADLLDLLGLSEFIGRNDDDYVAAAVQLATQPARWADYRKRIMQGLLDAPFFDTDHYGRDFAAELRKALTHD